MQDREIVGRAFAFFHADADVPPPLTLRGGDAADSYDMPESFDPALDEPTDSYIEMFAFHAIPFLDARSWRHYLPRLIDHVFRHPDDQRMVAEGLIASLRAPDREPPRLATLTAEQESVVVAFLEAVIRSDAHGALHDDARQALEEWWVPDARHRPTADELAARRNAPVSYHIVGSGPYRLSLPTTFTGSGLRRVPEESRTVESWSGHLCGDALTVVFVNVNAREGSLRDAVRRRAARLHRPDDEGHPVRVVGAAKAHRLDGLGYQYSPAELERHSMIFAEHGREILALTVRAWPRDDVAAAVERILESFEIVVAPLADDRRPA